jgi:tetratricopeptide (TPR) repeat protein
MGLAGVFFGTFLLNALAANEPDVKTTSVTSDLANQALGENLPQISAAVLRTQLQQEQDSARKEVLTRRLVALLVAGGRYDEALAVSTTADTVKDPILAYWKAQALLGTGDYAGARDLFTSLLESKNSGADLKTDQVSLGLACALRGEGKPVEALKILQSIPSGSPFAEDVAFEKGVDLILLGRTEEVISLVESFKPASEEGKAMALYLKALAAWHAGNISDAQKYFAKVPQSTPWSTAAATLGGGLCASAAQRPQEGIDLLEKHLDSVNDDPLIGQQFRLLDQLYAEGSAPDTALLQKWAEDASHPVRARLAAFFEAKGELRLHHPEGGEALLDAFIRKYSDDPLADQARVMLSASRLQRGLVEDARGWAMDRPAAPAVIRAKLAYLRGLTSASLGRSEEAKSDFQLAASLDPTLATDALFNQAVLIAKIDRGKLDASAAAKELVSLNAGAPSQEMKFQIALDLARRGEATGMALMGEVADQSSDPVLKSRARLAAAEWNMKSGKGDVADQDLAKAVHDNSNDPEREEYLAIFLKDTGKRTDAPGVITAAKAFLQAHPDSPFGSEVRLKLAEALLASGDVQGARVEFEQLALSGSGTEAGRRALFLAAQSAARAMDPSSINDSLLLLDRVAETDTPDQLVWQARLQQGALKNAQNLPQEALVIYDKIISSPGPDVELRAAALMARGDTLHQLGARDPAQEEEAVKSWQQIAADPSMPLRWRNQALCKSGMVLEKLGQGDAALADYYQAFKNSRTEEPELLWHDKAAFAAGRLLEARKQWKDAVTLYGEIVSEVGSRGEEAKARISKLRLENFLWEN